MRLVALAVVLAGAPAFAQDTPARVTASLHGTTARFALHVIATAANDFPAATLDVALPARGLVTAAAVTGASHRLALMRADTANDAFYALGDGGTRDAWAVLIAAAGGSVTIDIAAPARRTIALDLEVEAPTCFEHDQRFVQVPAAWKSRLATVRAPEGCGGSDDMAWIAFASPPPEHVGLIAGRLPLPASDIARVELDLSRELADIPADLHTAIIVDASRSLTATERDEQRAIIASYLRRVPQTSVQLVGYSRRAAPMLEEWTPAERAAAAIDRELRDLHPANGSNLDAGLAEAGAWLARTTGTRRVLLFTDERVARRLAGSDAAAFASFVPAGTLVHVVALRSRTGALQRDDGVRFGELAVATGGIGVRAASGTGVDATMLARPITLDDIAVSGAGWTEVPIAAGCSGGSLRAGTSCTWWGEGDPSSGPVTLTGALWNQRISRIVRPDPTRGLALARELSATGGLPASLQADVDRAALAVNSVWSLFAQWGGGGGYTSEGDIGTLSGTGSGHTTSSIVDTIGVTTVIPKVDLRAQLAGPLARCGAVHATIDLELTRDEIVDVRVAGAVGAERTCLEDAVWGTLVTVPDSPEVSRATLTL